MTNDLIVLHLLGCENSVVELGFVEAHQNSILRGQGFCLHEVTGKGTRPSLTVSWHASRVEGRSQRFTSIDEKRL